MTGSGTTSVNSGALTISGANAPMQLSRPLTIASAATATYTSSTNQLVVAYSGGSITNGGTFTLASPQQIGISGVPPPGTYLFTNNSGATLNGNGTIGVPVCNDGNQSGTSPASSRSTARSAGHERHTQHRVQWHSSVAFRSAQRHRPRHPRRNAQRHARIHASERRYRHRDDFCSATRSTDFTTKNLPTFPPNGNIQANYTPNSLQLLAFARPPISGSRRRSLHSAGRGNASNIHN